MSDDPQAAPLTIDLSPSEMHIAAIAGVQRALDGIRRNRQARYGCEAGAGFDLNIIGCAGELALAKCLDRFWNGAFGSLSAADVARQYQVRASAYNGPNAGLILHPGDNDQQAFVKVLVRLPQVTLIGWLFGRDGKQDRFWTELQAGRPCYLVPHPLLRPIAELAA
jgi:hypothetical protein